MHTDYIFNEYNKTPNNAIIEVNVGKEKMLTIFIPVQLEHRFNLRDVHIHNWNDQETYWYVTSIEPVAERKYLFTSTQHINHELHTRAGSLYLKFQ